MKQMVYCLFSACLALATTACKTDSKMNPQIHVHSHKLTIAWNGVARLMGGVPCLENTNLKFHEVIHRREKMPDTVMVYEFMHTFKDHVEIRAEISPSRNTVLFWLSPNNFHTQKASDFVGMLFDSLPGFAVGNAFYKYGPVGAWTHPSSINSINQIEPRDNQFLLWKYEDGAYAAALPLMGKGYLASLGQYNYMFGSKAYHSMNGHNENGIPILALAFGNDIPSTIHHLYTSALGMSNDLDSLKNLENSPSTIFQQLGWCSWNSLGHQVSHDSLIEVAKSFKENGLPIKWMLIDDGWSKVSRTNGKLRSFQADEVKFQKGLGHTIKTLKEEHAIEHVGVWHTLNGYWAGIDPDSELGIKYREKLYSYTDKVTWTEEAPSVFFLPSPENGEEFYRDWYTFLKNEGVDFVKVDNQLISEKVAYSQLPAEKAAKLLRHNFQKPADDIFGGNVLNCMCLTNEVLHHLSRPAVFRSSEDYFPENPHFHSKAGNEAVHIYNNILNNTWLHPLGRTDFDMFQSHRPHGFYHALARALHKGPIYCTDYPWQHNTTLLQSLCLKDGSLVQAESPLLPLDECLFQGIEDQILLATSHYKDTLLLGAWNTSPGFKRRTISLKELSPNSSDLGIVYDWNEKTATKTILSSAELHIHLPSLYCKHYLVFPWSDFVAMGLEKKFVSPAGLLKMDRLESEVQITLKEEGNFIAYSELPIASVVSVDGTKMNFEHSNNLLRVQADVPNFKIFFI